MYWFILLHAWLFYAWLCLRPVWSLTNVMDKIKNKPRAVGEIGVAANSWLPERSSLMAWYNGLDQSIEGLNGNQRLWDWIYRDFFIIVIPKFPLRRNCAATLKSLMKNPKREREKKLFNKITLYGSLNFR